MAAAVQYTQALLGEIASASHTFDDWRAQGQHLAEGQTTPRQFEIGDWLLEGEKRFGIRRAYQEARAIFSNRHNSLKDFASVARRVPACTRVHELSWGHHRLVARFAGNREYQCGLMKKAAKCGWSVGTFRKRIEAAHPSSVKMYRFRVSVPFSYEEITWIRMWSKHCACTESGLIRRILRDWYKMYQSGEVGDKL